MDDDRLCGVVLTGSNFYLCVYQTGQGYDKSILLSSNDLGGRAMVCSLRLDKTSHEVFVPYPGKRVQVFRLEKNNLVRVRALMCVENARNVALGSSGIMYVCDIDSKAVCLVSLKDDKVIHQLQLSNGEKKAPRHVAVLGNKIPGLL